MKTTTKIILNVIFIFFTLNTNIFAQNRYALVIGNNKYTKVQVLENPVNDATDIAAKLKALGYQVELQTNIGKAAMDRAIYNYMQRLAGSRENEGFFWFAGHGVQIDGENYLLPVDVDDTDDLSVRHTSYSVKLLTESFDSRAKNKVNIVVLDACRNNPFKSSSGTRSLSRGLSVIKDNELPSDLFIIFSTAADTAAKDGTGKRNSPFAEAFMKNMDSSEDISIVVRSITMDTLRLTNNTQRPFTGGSIISLNYYSIKSGINKPQTTTTTVTPQPAPVVQPPPIPANMVYIKGGTFTMGSPANEPERINDEVQHQVTVSSFYMGKYPVTVGEFQRFVNATRYRTEAEKDRGGFVFTGSQWELKADANWRNPYFSQGDNNPVVLINWNDAVQYCNWLSGQEKLTPAYTINGNNVTLNKNANGYRLPTEAEWEYACRAGTTTPFSTGNNITTSQANYNGNGPYNNNAKGEYRKKTTAVGSFTPNTWGLYDMHGNVNEWCWDWYENYSSKSQNDPIGADSGFFRVFRGGSWIKNANDLRSARRDVLMPDDRFSNIGFRIVRP